MKYLIVMALFFGGFVSQAQKSDNKLAPFYYLLGEYDIKVFTPDSIGQWQADGTGVSTYSMLFDSTYIDEMFVLNMTNATLTMRSTLGVDGRTKGLRLVALDKEFSSMDVYAGRAEGEKLILSNLDSDEAFATENAGKISFRLTVTPSKTCHHEMLVEYTNDQGKTWKKFSRQEYYSKL
ncbi:hypothetical protein [Reichenbachiella sp.]|uniref:hypothetical protein n=1 Tax=Reichenbachiella sp. TaxID=2184521 RepID=UPI003BAFC081